MSEVDPAAQTVLRSADVPGPVDAIAYDPARKRIYADEDNGTHLFVIDKASLKLIKTIVLPGHKPEYLAVDPQTHDVYQNISDLAEIAVVDPATLAVKRIIHTPELSGNHPLQYDATYREIVVAGTNGVMSAYTPAGKRLGSLIVARFDQCDLDQGAHVLACAGSGVIARFTLRPGAAPEPLDATPVAPGVHNTAIDPQTHAVFVTWANRDGSGDFVQKLIPSDKTALDLAVPHYDHILVMIEENKSYGTVLDHGYAPAIAGLASAYGMATQMYAERHPSEPNYVALIGGDTFGIADDDSWFCVAGSTRENCRGSDQPGFVPHLVPGENLATQLAAKGLGWRAYLENIPAPGSLDIFSPETATEPAALYAAKHTGFTNFASVHADPNLTSELVGFDRLHDDLRTGNVPAFALIVPNQCNEMHGIDAPKSPPDCAKDDDGLVRRGDANVRAIVDEIFASPIWKSGTTAIVITWDEDGKADRVPGAQQGCCVVDAHNPGGGHIPTIVITNHGPRGLNDPTPYDHYSLLRTIEDALGLDGHLRHAGDATVLPMVPLFALQP